MKTSNTTSSQASHYERRGDSRTRRIASAVARKSWQWHVINLAWTAGPVTYIAMNIGHYMGFGKFAPWQNFIYFFGFTIIAGVCAIASSVFYDAVYEPRISNEQQKLLVTIDAMHVMLLSIRNRILAGFDPAERRLHAAYYILQGAAVTPAAIEVASYDLTQNERITQAVRQAHVYSEQGMFSHVDDIWLSVQEEMQSVKERLMPIAPQSITLLENRLRGVTPNLKNGLERTAGFIERVLMAAEQNDEQMMTLYDAMEMTTLAFELLNGRKIAVLEARLKGDKGFEDAQRALDDAWQNYRTTVRRRNSLLRLMVDALYQETQMELIAEFSDKSSQLFAALQEGLKRLPEARRKNYQRRYEMLLRMNRHVEIRRERLRRVDENYRKKWHSDGHKLTLSMQESDLNQAGFYIDERSITLSDAQKLELSHLLMRLLPEGLFQVSDTDVKRFAMEVGNELDRMISISKPKEQLAIESSNATNFGFITLENSAKTKSGWMALAVDATHENRRKASHQLARNLVHFYHLPLTEAIIALFVARFGSDEDYLRQLGDHTTHENSYKTEIPTAAPVLASWKNIAGGK